MIKEEYVSWDSAKLLKEAGFPQDGFLTYYSENGTMLHSQMHCTEKCARCTKYQAMRWLREQHFISVEVGVNIAERWCLNVWEFKRVEALRTDEGEDFPTYEAAAESGIQAACKYIIENSNL